MKKKKRINYVHTKSGRLNQTIALDCTFWGISIFHQSYMGPSNFPICLTTKMNVDFYLC